MSFPVSPSQYSRRKTCSKKCIAKLISISTKGIPKTEEHKANISKALVGKPRPEFSKKWKKAISLASKNRPKSKEHRKKIGQAHKKIAKKFKNRKNNRTKYKYTFSPNHPKCNSSGYIREHTFVMENFIGRFLKKNECVHHINGDKSDNRIENLELFQSQAEHMKKHPPWNKGLKL